MLDGYAARGETSAAGAGGLRQTGCVSAAAQVEHPDARWTVLSSPLANVFPGTGLLSRQAWALRREAVARNFDPYPE